MDKFEFIVLCREDTTPDGKPGRYILATQSRRFTTAEEALQYARPIAPAREPVIAVVVEVKKHEKE